MEGHCHHCHHNKQSTLYLFLRLRGGKIITHEAEHQTEAYDTRCSATQSIEDDECQFLVQLTCGSFHHHADLPRVNTSLSVLSPLYPVLQPGYICEYDFCGCLCYRRCAFPPVNNRCSGLDCKENLQQITKEAEAAEQLHHLALIAVVGSLRKGSDNQNLDANDWEERNSENIYNDSVPVRKGRNLPSLRGRMMGEREQQL